MAEWQRLAGDIPVDWALEHHEEIAGAARVRIDITAPTRAVVDRAGHRRRPTTDLARSLVTGWPSCASSAAAARAAR